MRRFWLVAFLFCAVSLQADDPASSSPHLLLTPLRLRRLQRDRERQTVRWINFQSRVRNVPNSPERGFELALYYAVTHDPERGREAVEWSIAHPCELRQSALIRDWIPGAGHSSACSSDAPLYQRDLLFQTIAARQDPESLYHTSWQAILTSLQEGGFRDPKQLYAAIEFIDAVRTNLHTDPREDDPAFFSKLPVELLLSLKPQQVEHPDWLTHIAALALVTLDPNLPASQYLQGWAMENSQMIREGPGVAYEFLWANPYLPGIGYQNLDPWIYDAHGRLFARTDWSTNACWIGISKTGVEEQNCPSGWQNRVSDFGTLALIPANQLDQNCLELPAAKGRQVFMLWNLQPNQPVSYSYLQKQIRDKADISGLWRVPDGVQGKVCLPR